MTSADNFLAEQTRIKIEWNAWQDVVREFKRLRIDVDDPRYHRLILAINVWGEQLHALRSQQPKETVERALTKYIEYYDKEKGKEQP